MSNEKAKERILKEGALSLINKVLKDSTITNGNKTYAFFTSFLRHCQILNAAE